MGAAIVVIAGVVGLGVTIAATVGVVRGAVEASRIFLAAKLKTKVAIVSAVTALGVGAKLVVDYDDHLKQQAANKAKPRITEIVNNAINYDPSYQNFEVNGKYKITVGKDDLPADSTDRIIAECYIDSSAKALASAKDGIWNRVFPKKTEDEAAVTVAYMDIFYDLQRGCNSLRSPTRQEDEGSSTLRSEFDKKLYRPNIKAIPVADSEKNGAQGTVDFVIR